MKAKQAVEKPMVETAVEALEAAFLKLNFSEDEWKTVLETRAKAEAEKAKSATESSSSTEPEAQAEGDQ